MPSKTITDTLSLFSGSLTSKCTKEALFYSATILSRDFKNFLPILRDMIFDLQFREEEIIDVKQGVSFEVEDLRFKYQDLLPDLLPSIAYSSTKKTQNLNSVYNIERSGGLGNPVFPFATDLQSITPKLLQEFHSTAITPENLIISCASSDPSSLETIHDVFSKINKSSVKQKQVSLANRYTGGTCIVSDSVMSPNPDDLDFVHVLIHFETPGRSHFLSPIVHVISSLMGGGGAFSAGGPGKGMYTRLYSQVLNRYYWVESLHFDVKMYKHTGTCGVFGIIPNEARGIRDVANVLLDQFSQLASKLVSTESLDRAKKMLKSKILIAEESDAVMVEEMGVRDNDNGFSTNELVERIDAVTQEDILKVSRALFFAESFPGWERSGDGSPTILVRGNFKNGNQLFKIDDAVKKWGIGGAKKSNKWF